MQEIMTITQQEQIADQVFKMHLQGSLVQQMQAPDQFIHIRLQEEDLLLRRPISLAEIIPEKNECVIIYAVVGAGTAALSQMKVGQTLDVLGPLGNGYDLSQVLPGTKALIIGGGIGVAPLYELAKQLRKKDAKVQHVFGFLRKSKIYYETEFLEFGDIIYATDDGSYGIKGHIGHALDALPASYQPDVIYACGPRGLLLALEKRYQDQDVPVFISTESRMACGIGACYACVCHKKGDETHKQSLKVCDEGPVFQLGEIII